MLPMSAMWCAVDMTVSTTGLIMPPTAPPRTPELSRQKKLVSPLQEGGGGAGAGAGEGTGAGAGAGSSTRGLLGLGAAGAGAGGCTIIGLKAGAGCWTVMGVRAGLGVAWAGARLLEAAVWAQRPGWRLLQRPGQREQAGPGRYTGAEMRLPASP